MEYIIKNFTLGTLGEPNENITLLEEETKLIKECNETFNNCDYVGTITIKGSHKHRRYANDLKSQFFLFEKIKDLIHSYSQYYCINYELHKCSEWIHSHFIFRPMHRSKVPRMRKEIYMLIEGHKLKLKSYRHRILIEKPYNIHNYIVYMFKHFDEMKFYNIHPHYKLKSSVDYICRKNLIENLDQTKQCETKDFSEKSEIQIPYIDPVSLVLYK